MLIYPIYFLGLEGSPFFCIFLIAILGIILGRYLRLWLCLVVSAITFFGSLFMLATMAEMAVMFALVDLVFSIVLSIAMWATVFISMRNTHSFQEFFQRVKSSVLR